MQSTKLLSLPQAAATLGVSKPTVLKMIQNGDLQAVKICERLKVPMPALEAILAGTSRAVDSQRCSL